jgi:hypothetical protein
VSETVKNGQKIAFLRKFESRKALCCKGLRARGGQSGGQFHSCPGK